MVIGMATGSAFGLGFYFQLKFNDMTPIIPFLLLGIGVDDIFVIGKNISSYARMVGSTPLILLCNFGASAKISRSKRQNRSIIINVRNFQTFKTSATEVKVILLRLEGWGGGGGF
jgi:hypothetical protein